MNPISQNYGYSINSAAESRHFAALNLGLSAETSAMLLLCPHQQTVPVYIVSKISQAYLHPGSNKSYRSYKQAAYTHSLNSKYMFDPATNLCTNIIASYLTFVQSLVAADFSLNMAAKTIRLKNPAFFLITYQQQPGRLAQLARAPARHAGGHWFKSSTAQFT